MNHSPTMFHINSIIRWKGSLYTTEDINVDIYCFLHLGKYTIEEALYPFPSTTVHSRLISWPSPPPSQGGHDVFQFELRMPCLKFIIYWKALGQRPHWNIGSVNNIQQIMPCCCFCMPLCLFYLLLVYWTIYLHF